MDTKRFSILLTILLCVVGTKALAQIAVENADGVTIYYRYINDGKELEVTNSSKYSGDFVIPEEVTYMNRTRKVTSIGEEAFRECRELTSITIPKSIKTIGKHAFKDCSKFNSLHITDLATFCCISCNGFYASPFIRTTQLYLNGELITDLNIPNSVTSIGDYIFCSWYELKSVTIPNSVTSIGNGSFSGSGLTSVSIPNSVTSIGERAFESCNGLTSVIIPNSITVINDYTFCRCSSLTSVTIPNSVIAIGKFAFEDSDIPTVISMIKNPFDITSSVFSTNTYNNATLYVPKGTIDKYKSKEGWKYFLFIEEGDGSGNTPTDTKKCEKPTISYKNGLLTYHCATEDAICQSTITDNDIKSYSGNEVQLGVTYEISVYATKAGYENSETATATLCWIDVEPKTQGLSSVANVRAMPVMIKADNGIISIEGAEDGMNVSVYTIDGVQEGSAIIRNGAAMVNTNIPNDSVAIVKIGNKSVKVVMK